MDDFDAEEMARVVYKSELVNLDVYEYVTNPYDMVKASSVVDEFVELSEWPLTESQKRRTANKLLNIIKETHAEEGEF